MKRILLALFLFGALTAMIVVALRPSSAEPTPLAKLKAQYAAKPKSSVDHSLFPQLRVRSPSRRTSRRPASPATTAARPR